MHKISSPAAIKYPFVMRLATCFSVIFIYLDYIVVNSVSELILTKLV